MRLRPLAASIAASLALIAGLVAGPGAAQADDTFFGFPEPPLRGANDFSCRPTAKAPNPVVLAHGLGATATENWYVFAPYLASQGFCVFAKTYGQDPRYPGRGGVQPMQDSAAELGAFVDKVLAATGARKVDIVGHSEGGLMPRHYLKFLGGARKVGNFVGWAAPNHGTNINGITELRSFYPGFDAEMANYCQSCPQFLPGSDFLRELNAGDETPGAVNYTVLVTRYDALVTPIETSFLDGAENIVIQDVAPTLAGHASMAVDPVTFGLTLAALGD